MQLLRNWFRPLKIRLGQLLFHVNIQLQSILVSIFSIGLLRLSAGTYKATSSTAANVVRHLKRF